MNNCLTKAGEPLIGANPNVVLLPAGQDFELYLVRPHYLDALRRMIVEPRVEKGGHNDQGKAALEQKWAGKDAPEISKELAKWKTVYGARVAKAFSTLGDETHRVPPKIRELLDAVKPPPLAEKEDTNGS